MKNVLMINGHQSYQSSEGRLNRTLFDHMAGILQEQDYAVQTTIIQEGYTIEEERTKFLWADLVIYQTPIYWFSVPGLFKTYMDEVYAYGLFFKGSDTYGQGGLLTGKKYMLSTTWNAPETAFQDTSQFFGGSGLEEVLAHLHRAHEFLGMQGLKSFACYDVVKQPKIDLFLLKLDAHLREALQTI
ncbi:NAD(P)H-dependent oxidoreductase [Paenibacillus favisporus]|uniref:NAD(P)H-dependent oxidoreductase n=1 Tax=Paenibacillus TaxID=44249 RepID=UPI0011AB4244|nr:MULTISPECIES: NAD(P)H-dependent oxidoreductase [Paenibacillus]MEC0177510.1 NAD(P)H-dependent oxidoreductase [Paenibacillus favisporus]